MKVYVVVSGPDYEAGDVLGVFTDKAVAEEVGRANSGIGPPHASTWAEVTEVEVDDRDGVWIGSVVGSADDS